jgi:putative PIN family toxin of toxin-antitoxin system
MPRKIVIDTNVTLDLCLFADPATDSLRQDLQQPAWCWIATRPMRDELERVLAYPHLALRLQKTGRSAAQLLDWYDASVQWHEVAPRCRWACKDPDDQRFIDLAVQHQAVLLSKDAAVLAMVKRLRTDGVSAGADWALVRTQRSE